MHPTVQSLSCGGVHDRSAPSTAAGAAEKRHDTRHQSDDKRVVLPGRFVQQEGVSSVSWAEQFSASVDNSSEVFDCAKTTAVAHSDAGCAAREFGHFDG